MDSISKDWKILKEELANDIKKAQEEAKEDKETFDLMLSMLENSRIKVRSMDN